MQVLRCAAVWCCSVRRGPRQPDTAARMLAAGCAAGAHYCSRLAGASASMGWARQQPHERQRFQEMATPCCAKPVRNSSNIFWLCSREALATSFTSLATSSILW